MLSAWGLDVVCHASLFRTHLGSDFDSQFPLIIHPAVRLNLRSAVFFLWEPFSAPPIATFAARSVELEEKQVNREGRQRGPTGSVRLRIFASGASTESNPENLGK